MLRAVYFYKTEKGHCPVEDFLDGLPSAVVQKILWVLKLLQEHDVVPRQYFKKPTGTDDIWECRIVYGGNTYRLFGFFDKGGSLILTNGLMKKTHNIPPKDILRAEALRSDYLQRR